MKKIFTLAAAVAVALGMSAEINILRGTEVMANETEFELGYKDEVEPQTWNPNLFVQATAGSECTVKVESNCAFAQFCGAFNEECMPASPSATKTGTFADDKALPLEIHIVLVPGMTLPENTTITVTVWENATPEATKTITVNCVDLPNSEVEENGIENIFTADQNAPAEYFNIQGVRVNNPVKGSLYIVRQGSKTSKVIF